MKKDNDYIVAWRPQPGPQTKLLTCPAEQVFFGGARGGGKLAPYYSKIATPKGWTTMGEVKVGDVVTDPTTGGHSTVIGVYPQGKKKIYKITCDDGAVTYAGLEHLWAYKLPNHHRPRTKESAQRKFAEGELGISYPKDKWNHLTIGSTQDLLNALDKGCQPRIPLTEPVLYTVNGRCGTGASDSYLIGLMLGDGSFGNLSLTACDDEIRDYALKSGFRACSTLHSDGKPKTYALYGKVRDSFDLWMRNNGLKCGGWHARAWEKFLPEFVHTAPIDYRLSLLQGLMDTDGYVDDRGRCYYTSVSEKLIKGVQLLVWGVGGKAYLSSKIPTYTYKGEKLEGRLAYTLHIQLHKSSSLFRLTRKKDRCTDSWNGGYQMMRAIESIEEKSEEEAKCIQVSSPYGLYITDDFIVTHNTAGVLGLWAAHAQKYGEHAKGVLFRRTYPELEEVMEQARRMYAPLGAEYMATPKTWKFPNGATLRLRHLQFDKDTDNYLGHQYCVAVGTPILMADGTSKAIEKIKEGEYVQTLEGPRKVLAAIKPYIAPCVKVRSKYKGRVIGEQVQPIWHRILTTDGLSFGQLGEIPRTLQQSFEKNSHFGGKQQSASCAYLTHTAPTNATRQSVCRSLPIDGYLLQSSRYIPHIFQQSFSAKALVEPNGVFDIYGQKENWGWLSYQDIYQIYCKESVGGPLRISPLPRLSYPVMLHGLSVRSVLMREDSCCISSIANQIFCKLYGWLKEKYQSCSYLSRHWSFLPYKVRSYDKRPNVLSCVSFVRNRWRDFLVDCRGECHFYDEPSHSILDTGLNDIHRLDDVVGSVCSYECESDTIRIHTHSCPPMYKNPYTGEERVIQEDCVMGEVEIEPYGLQLVADISVENSNHYITSSTGIISSNSLMIFEELGNFPSPKPIDELMGCLRSAAGVPCQWIATGNPGGPGHCLPEGDVLTATGWKPIQNIVQGELVYTVDADKNLLLSPVDQVHRYHYQGDMPTVKAKGLFLTCTPNHRVPVIYKDGFVLTEFRHTPFRCNMLRGGLKWKGTPVPEIVLQPVKKRVGGLNQPLTIQGTDYAELCGWMVSEGHVCLKNGLFCISQMKAKHRTSIVTLLRRCGFKYRLEKEGITVSSREWAEHFAKLGKCREKYVPEVIKQGTQDDLWAFFCAAVAGDGSWHKNRGVYFTSSSRLVGDMEEIALKLGYTVCTSVSKKRPHEYVVRFKPKFFSVLRTGHNIYKTQLKTTRSQTNTTSQWYDGLVYCLGVQDTHTFIVRQRGCVWVSGNSWIKARFIDPAPPYTPHRDPITGAMRVFIPAKVSDNQLLLKNDPGYVDRLKGSGPPWLVRAWLDGDWNIIAGGMFEDVWNSSLHVVKPFVVPSSWYVDRAMDWGSSRPYSVGWWAESDGTGGGGVPIVPRGTLFRIFELYGWNGKANEGNRRLAVHVASDIKEHEDRIRKVLKVSHIYDGPADVKIFSRENGMCIADDFSKMGVRWYPADQSSGSRVFGAELLRKRLKQTGTEEPGIYIFETCRNWVRTVPVLPRDKSDPDDVACFVAGTQVSTQNGDKPIEEIQVGELVWTPIGLRKVLYCKKSGTAKVFELKMSAGKVLIGTPDHPIFIEGRGFIELQNLKPGDILHQWRVSLWLKVLHIMVWFIDGIRKDFITRLQVFTSTTKITTTTTTPLKNQKLKEEKRFFKKTLRKCSKTPPYENLRAVIAESLLKQNIKHKNFAQQSVWKKCVSNIGRNLAQFAEKFFLTSLIPTKKSKPVVISVDGLYVEREVFNLVVEQAHVFFANGILVSNTEAEDHCYDETKYELMHIKPVLKEVKLLGV
jgi:intein/homing endonuclease